MQAQQLHCRFAFTLVELLFILAILGVVVWLLLPILNDTREKERIGCASNLRQIGIALMAYAGDNGQHIPTLGCNAGSAVCDSSGVVTWDMALTNGYLSAAVLKCPSDKAARGALQIPRSHGMSLGTDSANNYTMAKG